MRLIHEKNRGKKSRATVPLRSVFKVMIIDWKCRYFNWLKKS
jgi:hypothetical protein